MTIPSLTILALAGTWTLNVAKSHSSEPLPTSRTLVISRTATGYLMRQIDGTDTTTVTISLAGTGPSAALNDGASAIRYTARAAGDTIALRGASTPQTTRLDWSVLLRGANPNDAPRTPQLPRRVNAAQYAARLVGSCPMAAEC